MANIKGQGRPTIYTKANKGDIYTDTNTGIKYECLGPDGFVEAGDIEKNKYDWKEIKTSGGGTGGVSSWNDLTDRPFGEMVERTTIWENKEISFRLSQKVDGSFYGLAGFSDTMGYALETGAKYVVVYDGAEYECVAGDWGHLGDFDLANFPFSIALDMGLTLYADTAGTHTFSIYAVKETIETLEEKFIPDVIARKSDIQSGGVSSWNELTDKPFGEKVIGDKQLCIEPQTIHFVQATDMNGNPFPWTSVYLNAIGRLDDAELGDVAIVVIDGVEYEFEAQVKGESAPYFGNMSIADDTFVEPLYPDAKILILLGGGGGTCVFYLDDSLIGEHEISVYLAKTEETKLSYNDLADLPVYEKVNKLIVCEDWPIEITAYEAQNGPSSYVTVYGLEHFSTIGDLGKVVGSGPDPLVDWEIKDGDKAIVVFDGETHEFEFRSFKYYGSENLDFSIGNSELSYRGYNDGVVTDDNLYITSNNGYFDLFATSDLVGTHTISIYAEQSELKQLDPKFIPDTIARKSDVSGGKELVVTVTDSYYGTDTWNAVGAETNMSWADAKAAVLDGSLTKVVVLEHLGDEYEARISNATIRSASLDDGMNFSLCIDYMVVKHNGAATITVNTRSIIWKESGDMSGKEKQIIA